jgi:hypothetical protein
LASACIAGTTVTFPSTSSTTKSGTLDASSPFFRSGDYVTESFPRTAPVSKLTVNFKMSDHMSTYCSVGTLSWNVMVNGTVVGSYSWIGGTGSGSGPDQTIAQTFTFAPIAPSAGSIVLRYEATTAVCSGAGYWTWYPGGTAVLQ